MKDPAINSEKGTDNGGKGFNYPVPEDSRASGRECLNYLREDIATSLSRRLRGHDKNVVSEQLVKMLKAKRVKAKWDTDSGEWKYSAPLTDWMAIGAALRLIGSWVGLEAPQEHKVSLPGFESFAPSLNAAIDKVAARRKDSDAGDSE